MQSGYYDCSSLVWRAYKKAGVTVVKNTGWAPVAADIGRWLIVTKNRDYWKMTYNRVIKFKFKPGDLGFQTGSSNGRYKGIYHVEMFAGYEYEGYSGDTAVVGPIWANRYPWYTTSIVVSFP